MIHGANLFFRIAGNPVTVHADRTGWHERELSAFRLLHGDDGYDSFATPDGSLMLEQVPGQALPALMRDGALPQTALAAAGREMARAHGMTPTNCTATPEAWSHGDSHLGNFIYDAASDRARLIDFEVSHHPHLMEPERHAEDLLAFLQDLMGRVHEANWLPQACCFLEHYRECLFNESRDTNGAKDTTGNTQHPHTEAIFSALAERLTKPNAKSRLWWAVRTSYLEGTSLTRRILALRSAISQASLR